MDVFEKFESMSPTPTTNRLHLNKQELRRFLEKIEVQSSSCWLWTASKPNGYGQIRISSINGHVPLLAHILSYRMSIGEIPVGHQLHHKTEDGCIGSACVNPAHLICVTPSRHIDLTPTCPSAINRMRTECIRGHEFTPENTRITKSGGRSCRACEKIRDAEWAKRNSTGNPSGRPMQSHCINGHPLSGDNLYVSPNPSKRDGHVLRGCMACRNQRVKEYRDRNHEKVLADKKRYREEKKQRDARAFYDQFA